MERLQVIDSHTAGEPTRVIIAGGPPLGVGALATRRERFHREFDRYRSAVVNEPRGSDVIVGAMLVEPEDKTCATGVIFFNNVGYIGMCGHGTIGVVTTLAYLGRIRPGVHGIETPVGRVSTVLHDNGEVSVTNVASWRKARNVEVDVPGVGFVVGDIAWGGNWFFLVEQNERELTLANAAELTDASRRIRGAVNAKGFADVDHVELFARPVSAKAQSRSFVLCPGDAYDRSPCGTGTSAKLACLAADGKLAEGAPWVQESVVGTTFKASYRWLDRDAGKIEPTITGTAFVNAESTHIIEERDPFSWGMR